MACVYLMQRYVKLLHPEHFLLSGVLSKDKLYIVQLYQCIFDKLLTYFDSIYKLADLPGVAWEEKHE